MALGVDFVDPNTGWVVGEGGKILKTTDGGTNWTAQTSGTASYLLGVYFANAGAGWVVGGNGTILKYSQGGGVSVSAQAPVPPQVLTFSVTAGAAPDGGSVTDGSIDFGMLSGDTPKSGTQTLAVTTNAQGGYNVTGAEDHPLQSGANVIPDVTGDNENITKVESGPWNLNTTYGFGYTLSGADADFSSPDDYKQFANKEGGEWEQVVMSNAGPVTDSQATVTYKVNIPANQPPGTYSNTVTYVATGNF